MFLYTIIFSFFFKIKISLNITLLLSPNIAYTFYALYINSLPCILHSFFLKSIFIFLFLAHLSEHFLNILLCSSLQNNLEIQYLSFHVA